MRALISLVLGAVLLVGGYFWAASLGHSVMTMVAAIVMGLGGALIVTAIAMGLDNFSPTSRKLGK
ncbi:hypothetical protein CATRI_02595 [Corynebacterium atrinae]|uniref:hypothetical protein n=1 Tax=Corynebacterium atrinae TaxID=1336740 RepID=UPI0025B56438|nr:hypothetical protein [Corynebacterium atrinae]WJY62624.1 hypothetical protein CATRI_02595 [Corynebacterium atrinae]